MKIIVKFLVLRLEKCLPSIIGNAQNGFIKNHQAYCNIRRLLSIIYEKGEAQDSCILSLDAEKAFDRVEWPYLFDVLPRFGFSVYFRQWVRLLYSGPCTLVLEPFSISIRNDPVIKGIRIADVVHHIAYSQTMPYFL